MNISKKEHFEKEGRVWFRKAVSDTDLKILDESLNLQDKAGQRIKADKQICEMLSPKGSIMSAINEIQPNAKPVRIVAFNKSEQNNWGVPWHQDRIIAVNEKHEITGFENWTKKSEIWHCEPPQEILDQMLFFRIHMDDSDDLNGAMNIALSSHKEGIIPAEKATEISEQYVTESCHAERGDILILKMLILHNSLPSQNLSQRRVIRIDFASFDLPKPLKWIGHRG